MQTAAKNVHVYDVALDQQLTQLHSQIRVNPGKVELRIHLAQLLMVTGQWEKALQQLQTAAQLDAKSAAMAQTYRALIQAEIYREQTFVAEREPNYLGNCTQWQALIAEALIARAHHQVTAADKFQQQAYDDAPGCRFTVDDKEAQWIADADSRLGPICEVFINGSYYWLPFDQIQQLTLEPPQDLRDLIWIPTSITLKNFTQHFGFLPSRYVFSYAQHNDQLSLSSLTEWLPLSEHSWAGVGQKMLTTDQGEYPLLTIRTLTQRTGD